METFAIVSVDDPTPVSYLNLYERGDRWEKIKGCKGCKEAEKCCGNCPMLVKGKCFYHLEKRKYSAKPFKCVVAPVPTIAMSWCQLEYECVEGTMKGKVRRVRDKGNVFK